MAASIAYLTLSGVLGWCFGGMTWWWIVLHMVAGGVLAACLVLLAAFRHHLFTGCAFAASVWTLWTVLAAATVFTAVMPMMTVFGSEGQVFLLWSHRLAALAFAAVSAALCLLELLPRRK